MADQWSLWTHAALLVGKLFKVSKCTLLVTVYTQDSHLIEKSTNFIINIMFLHGTLMLVDAVPMETIAPVTVDAMIAVHEYVPSLAVVNEAMVTSE